MSAEEVLKWKQSQWFSAAELAALNLPGLPKNKRKMNERISKEGWASRVDRMGISLARKRKGRGGGLEYHIGLLSPVVRNRLMRSLAPELFETDSIEKSSSAVPLWDWFNQQPQAVKDEAKRRLKIVSEVVVSSQQGRSKTAAVYVLAGLHSISSSTIWKWLSFVRGCAEGDWLPNLAPRKNLSKAALIETTDSETLNHEIIGLNHRLSKVGVQISKMDQLDKSVLRSIDELKSSLDRLETRFEVIERRLGLSETEH